MDPLDMMNSDCWKVVIEFLSGKDKHSVSATCKSFENLLQAKRSEWMFDAILPCISDWLDVPVRQQFSFRGYCRPRRRITWRNLLNCRLVSKSWCYSVDYFMANWYKEEDGHKYGDGNSISVSRQPQLNPFYWFIRDDDEQRFMERFPNSSRNPFLGRSVYFNADEVPEMVMVRAAAAAPSPYNVVNGQLLELYGKHIWIIQLTTFAYERLRENFCQNFQRLLSCLPNLRTLKILVQERDTEWSENSYRAQAKLVKQFPLPELPYLERIQYYEEEGDNNYKSVQLLLDKYCGALKRLEWSARSSRPELTHFAQMKCLKSLQLYGIPEADSIFEVLRALQCPLEYLSLGVCFFHPYPYVDPGKQADWHMDRFLESIQHLPVRDLKLHLNNRNILCCDNEAHPLPDTYPENTTIQTLFIKSQDNIRASFNFLPQLRSLASFTFWSSRVDKTGTITDYPNVPKVLELEYCSSKENVHLMKIWEKVPSLKALTYRKGGMIWDRQQRGDVDLVFSREEYDRLVLENTVQE